MRFTSGVHPRILARNDLSSPVLLFLLAVHIPALLLGGNRFGYVAPTAGVMLFLLIWRAPSISPPRYASWLWLGVMAWGGVQIAHDLTPDAGEAARILTRFALYAGIFLIAADLARQPFLGEMLIRATALWIAMICIYGVAAWTLGVNPVLAELEAYAAPLEATFVNRNAFALYAVFGLLASSGLHARTLQCRHDGGGRNWLWIILTLACGIAVLMTGSRGGLAAGVVGIAIFIALRRNSPTPTIVLLAALFCAGLASAGYVRDASILNDPRFAVHGEILAQTAKAPLVGHGLGAFQDAFRPSLGAEWRWGDWDHAHQQYLETAFELGWPAAIALFLAIALAAPRPVRGDPFAVVALAALGAAAAHALVDFSLTIPSVAMTLALLLGAASGRQRRAR